MSTQEKAKKEKKHKSKKLKKEEDDDAGSNDGVPVEGPPAAAAAAAAASSPQMDANAALLHIQEQLGTKAAEDDTTRRALDVLKEVISDNESLEQENERLIAASNKAAYNSALVAVENKGPFKIAKLEEQLTWYPIPHDRFVINPRRAHLFDHFSLLPCPGVSRRALENFAPVVLKQAKNACEVAADEKQFQGNFIEKMINTWQKANTAAADAAAQGHQVVPRRTSGVFCEEFVVQNGLNAKPRRADLVISHVIFPGVHVAVDVVVEFKFAIPRQTCQSDVGEILICCKKERAEEGVFWWYPFEPKIETHRTLGTKEEQKQRLDDAKKLIDSVRKEETICYSYHEKKQLW